MNSVCSARARKGVERPTEPWMYAGVAWSERPYGTGAAPADSASRSVADLDGFASPQRIPGRRVAGFFTREPGGQDGWDLAGHPAQNKRSGVTEDHDRRRTRGKDRLDELALHAGESRSVLSSPSPTGAAGLLMPAWSPTTTIATSAAAATSTASAIPERSSVAMGHPRA